MTGSRKRKNKLGNNGWGVYVQLKDGINPEQTNAKIKDMVLSHLSSDDQYAKTRKA
jgi:putative ABC transport system permease protein